MRHLHISGRAEDRYFFDEWRGPDREDWIRRKVDFLTNVSDDASIGDVYTKAEREPADEDVAEAIRTEYATLQAQLEATASELGVDLSDEHESLDDGDILLEMSPWSKGDWMEQHDPAHAFSFGPHRTNGLHLNGVEFLRSRRLINCRTEALEPGMVFEIDSLDGPVSAFVFDRERTREVQQQRGRVKLLNGRGGAVDIATGAESPEDLEPPYYANIRGYDDGQYYSTIYDSGAAPEDDYDGFRAIADASAKPPHLVRESWIGNGLVPIDELHFEDHPDAPVAFIDPDAEPLDVDR